MSRIKHFGLQCIAGHSSKFLVFAAVVVLGDCWSMAIEWDLLIAEMSLLAGIIYGAIYVENWVEKRKVHRKEKEDAKRTIDFVASDLHKKARFIEESIQFKDFKPFFTDMWDAVILGGKQTLLPFELFENLQHTYSWMKYYNNEIEQWEEGKGDKVIIETLKEVTNSINESLTMLKLDKS